MFIAVDVGNSHVSFSAHMGAGLHTVAVAWSADSRRFLLPDRSAPVDVWDYLQQTLLGECLAGAPSKPESDLQNCPRLSWWIASVNPPATEQWREVLQNHRPHDHLRVIDPAEVPLRDDLQNRRQTGVDRLLAAWYVSRHLSAIQTAEAPATRGVIVVDAGSAVTVDWVDGDGVFRGGMIYPGFRLAANSLHRDTAALPLLTAVTTTPPPAAGRKTAEAIEAGLFWSQWGGLCGAVEALQRFASANEKAPGVQLSDSVRPRVVVTGGGIRSFHSLLPPQWRWEPQLMPQAILKLAEVTSREAGGGAS